MKEWFRASELAGLPGMPGTERRARSKAQREGWRWRKAHKGKGREYHISSLPPKTRAHLQRDMAVQAVSAMVGSEALEQIVRAARAASEEQRRVKEEGLKQFAAMPDGPKKQRLRARRWLIEALWEFRRAHGGTKSSSRLAFCDAINGGELEIPAWVMEFLPRRHGVHHLTEPTLERWEQAYRARGIMALADRYGNRTGQGKIDRHPELKRVVLGLLLQHPHITARKVVQYLAAEHPQLPRVSASAITRFVTRWKRENAQLWTYLTNPDQWKNVHMVAYGSHTDDIQRINQRWELDSTPADWMLQDGRHCVIGVIDLYSRRLKFRVSKTSKAAAVCLAFRDAVLDWGVPESVRTDNGQDYVSEHFTGVLRDLQIVQQLCMLFASEQKGTIERAMRTMSHGILDLLPGFIGHNVAERKVIEARKSFAERVMQRGEVVEAEMTAEELQKLLDEWCEHVYARNPHEGLGGRTPFEMAAGHPVRRISDPHALDLLLLEVAGTRTVGKKGIRFEHHYYSAPELVAHTGREVRLRRDPDDIGRLYVYSEEGFICIAECDQLLGLSPAEKAAAAKALQKRLMAEQKAELKEAMRAIRRNPAQAILEHRIREAENVTAFPAPSEPYSTPALEAAAEARQAAGHQAPPDTQAEVIDYAAFRDEFEQHNRDVLEETDLRKIHAHWLRVEARIEAGESVSEEERLGLEGYKASGQYQSQQEFFEAFGLTAEDF